MVLLESLYSDSDVWKQNYGIQRELSEVRLLINDN